MHKLKIFALSFLAASSACAKVGMKDGFLNPAPRLTSNCVISQKIKGRKPNIDPIVYSCSKQQAYERLLAVINAYGDTKIIAQTDDYIHVEFTIGKRRYIDDVEFYFPQNESVVHVRSASRVGVYDFDVNRKRVEKIREMFNERA